MLAKYGKQMKGLKKLSISVRDSEFHTKDGGILMHDYWHSLKKLHDDLILEELYLVLELEMKPGIKIEGWPLSHFLDRRYTRRSKSTFIDLQNDYVILDVRL